MTSLTRPVLRLRSKRPGYGANIACSAGGQRKRRSFSRPHLPASHQGAPGTLSAWKCGAYIQGVYTATFHVNPGPGGGLLAFSWTVNNGRSQTNENLTINPGQSKSTSSLSKTSDEKQRAVPRTTLVDFSAPYVLLCLLLSLALFPDCPCLSCVIGARRKLQRSVIHRTEAQTQPVTQVVLVHLPWIPGTLTRHRVACTLHVA